VQGFLNQSRFPRLWKAFHYVAGGLHDKRALCLLKLRALLTAGASLLADDGQLVVVDPVSPERDDPAFFHLFLRLEQGSFVRASEALDTLLRDVPELTLVSSETHVVGDICLVASEVRALRRLRAAASFPPRT